MKIKTITCHDVYNSGASLQAFALQHYLESRGHDVQIIDYKPNYLSNHFNLWAINPKYNKPLLREAYWMAKLPNRIKARARKKPFDQFTQHYLHLTRRYSSVEELRKDPPEADVYIAGSDQIWNTTLNNGTDAAFYLDFGSARKISYAASFATPALREGTGHFVKQRLKNFDAISVREKSGIVLLNNLGYEGNQVVDPVFLLSKEDWDALLSDNYLASQSELKEPYILVYNTEYNSPINEVAIRLAKLRNCKIYSMSHSSYAQKIFVNNGPLDFVALVKGAQCVVSNSFHATAFAMIFGRDTFVVNRKDGLNQRMKDLLEDYNLCNRLISPATDDAKLAEHIDYSKVHPILEKNIVNSKDWLDNNTNG